MKQEDFNRVLFDGKEYLLNPDAKGPEGPWNSPLFTWEQFENFEKSYAYVYNTDNPRILRHGLKIGEVSDLTWLERS